MKAAISSAGPGLDSGVDPRFGRCAYLIFYDMDSGAWEAVPNANRDTGGGANIRTAQMVIDRGARAVVTGNSAPTPCRSSRDRSRYIPASRAPSARPFRPSRKAGSRKPPPPP